MVASQQELAVCAPTTVDIVHEALRALVARYRADEVLTSVQHIAAREAQFQPVPGWVRHELTAAYPRQGYRAPVALVFA